jgi:hypothetical protein
MLGNDPHYALDQGSKCNMDTPLTDTTGSAPLGGWVANSTPPTTLR